VNAGGVAFERYEHKRETISVGERTPGENTAALQRPKHHGSQTRQLIPVTGCVPSHIAAQLEKMRDQKGKKRLSRSAVVADILKKLRIDTLCHESLTSQKVTRFSHLTFRQQNMPQMG
jgi:hypothetical protein